MGDRDSVRRDYEYDELGREISVSDFRQGKVDFKTTSTWSADGRSKTMMWAQVGGDSSEVQRYVYHFDERDRIVREENLNPKAVEYVVYDWSAAQCDHAPAKRFSDAQATVQIGRVAVTCTDGRTTQRSIYGLADTPTRQTTFDYDESGRIDSRTRITFGTGGEDDRRFSYRSIRDGRGLTTGMRFDSNGHGMYDEREYWDVSCWKTEPTRVSPNKPEEKQKVTSQAPSAMTRALGGRWETKGKFKIRVSFDFEVARITLSQGDKDPVHSPLKVLARHIRPGAEKPSALDVSFRLEGKDRTATVRPLQDDVISVEFDGEGPSSVLTRPERD